MQFDFKRNILATHTPWALSNVRTMEMGKRTSLIYIINTNLYLIWFTDAYINGCSMSTIRLMFTSHKWLFQWNGMSQSQSITKMDRLRLRHHNRCDTYFPAVWLNYHQKKNRFGRLMSDASFYSVVRAKMKDTLKNCRHRNENQCTFICI